MRKSRRISPVCTRPQLMRKMRPACFPFDKATPKSHTNSKQQQALLEPTPTQQVEAILKVGLSALTVRAEIRTSVLLVYLLIPKPISRKPTTSIPAKLCVHLIDRKESHRTWNEPSLLRSIPRLWPELDLEKALSRWHCVYREAEGIPHALQPKDHRVLLVAFRL